MRALENASMLNVGACYIKKLPALEIDLLDKMADAGPSRLASPGATYARFIVLGDARTGSYMLVQALESHPNITCFSELFNWQLDYVDFKVAGYDSASTADRALRDRAFERFLRERIYCDRPPEMQAVGFKLLYAHVWGTTGLLDRLIADSDIRVLHLKRRNFLRMLVSTKLAEATGLWRLDREITLSELVKSKNWRRGLLRPLGVLKALRMWMRPPVPLPESMDKKAVRLTIDECKTFFHKAQHEVDHFAGLFAQHPMQSVWYEDMVANRNSVFGEVQSFLGVAPARLTVTLARQNPEPLRELIENYDELKAAFRRTAAAPFFD